jgi:hypothetical protein
MPAPLIAFEPFQQSMDATMRLSEEQVKQGLLHPEQMVRDVALRYFNKSFSDDPTIMPLAIEAIETHGWENAFRFSYGLADLAQTEETLLWLIDRLNRQGRPENRTDIDHCFRLSSMISKADVPARIERAATDTGGRFHADGDALSRT